MAKSKDVQLIPSGGVLVAALVAAIIAAVLMNVYISGIRAAYTQDAKTCIQFIKDVPQGTIIDDSHLAKVTIPVRLNRDGVFDTAITEDDYRGLIIGKAAPRTFYRGDFVFRGDWSGQAPGSGLPDVPPGHMLVEIKVSQDTHLSKAIRPGSYVQVLGDFNPTPESKSPSAVKVVTVLQSVKVVLIDGDATVPASTTGSTRTISSIHVILRNDVGKQVLQLEKLLVSKRFAIELGPLPASPDAPVAIDNDTVSFFRNLPRASATGSSAPLPLP